MQISDKMQARMICRKNVYKLRTTASRCRRHQIEAAPPSSGLDDLPFRGPKAVSDLSNYLPTIPDTLVDRLLWLENNHIQRPVMEILRANNDIFGVVGLLLTDIESVDHSPAPHPRAAKLLALAAERP